MQKTHSSISVSLNPDDAVYLLFQCLTEIVLNKSELAEAWSRLVGGDAGACRIYHQLYGFISISTLFGLKMFAY